MDSGEGFYAEWTPDSWSTVYELVPFSASPDNACVQESFNLSATDASVNNNANGFEIRFSCLSNAGTEECFLDNVIIKGRDSSENLDVDFCFDGTFCDEVEYDEDDDGEAHTIGAGQTGAANWTDTSSAVGATDTIDTFEFTLRHSGEAGIDGSWGIDWKRNSTGDIYCSDNTIFHSDTDTTDSFFFNNCDGGWTKDKLDDLTIDFNNGDTGSPHSASILFADIVITFSASAGGEDTTQTINLTLVEIDDNQFGHGRSSSETISISDLGEEDQKTLIRGFIEEISTSESNFDIEGYQIFQVEGLTINEIITTISGSLRQISQFITISESVETQLSFTRNLIQDIALSEIVFNIEGFFRNFPELLTISESIELGIGKTFAELLTISDSIERSLTLIRGSSELLSITESIDILSAFGLSLSENLIINELVNINKALNSISAEILTATDLISTNLALVRFLDVLLIIRESIIAAVVVFVPPQFPGANILPVVAGAVPIPTFAGQDILIDLLFAEVPLYYVIGGLFIFSAAIQAQLSRIIGAMKTLHPRTKIVPPFY